MEVEESSSKKSENIELEEMLQFLSIQPGLRVKSQQMSESELTSSEKLNELKQLFEKNKSSFLARFGPQLTASHLKLIRRSCCDQDVKQSSSFNFHLAELEKNLSEGKRQTTAKNRRYAALQKLVDSSDYFSEEEMQGRNPILFDQLIGKYHSPDERSAFSALCSQKANKDKATPLSDMFMAHMNRTESGESCRRLGQEEQQNRENEADLDYLDEMKINGENEEGDHYEIQNGGNGQENTEEIDEDEKEIYKEEFFTTMYRNFLGGKDPDFDYTTVDDNEEYDNCEVLDQDEEDKYFESEEPSGTNSPSHNDDKKETQKSSSEDELDIYMKSIQNQISQNISIK